MIVGTLQLVVIRLRFLAVAAVLTAWVVAVSAPVPGAAASVTTNRLAGTDRYDTAAVIAEAAFPSGVGSVVVASGVNFADALAGAYYAGAGAPACPQSAILLTAPDSLPPATQKALTTLKATRATILGGTAAVSANVASQLQSLGLTVSRVGGASRYATMLGLDTACGLPAQKLAFVASGTNYPDALAAAGASYGRHIPMVLTDPGNLTPEAAGVLTKLGITQVVVLGGASAVSAAAKAAITALGITITQNIAGVDRSDTSVQLARWEVANLGFSTTSVALARGDDFADALAGAQLTGGSAPGGAVIAHAPGAGKPTMEITPDKIGPAVTDFLGSEQVNQITVLGGTKSVSDAAVATAVAAAGGGSTTTAPGGWSVTGFSPNQLQLKGTTGVPFTITGTFPSATTVLAVVAGENLNTPNESEDGCTPLRGAAQKASSTNTKVTGNLVLPDDCPPGPYDVIVTDVSGSVQLRLKDAFTVIPAITSIHPGTLAADGAAHTLSITGRSIRTYATFCMVPSGVSVNAGTPCNTLPNPLTGKLSGTESPTVFDVDFTIPKNETQGNWTVLADMSDHKGGVGQCSGCVAVGSEPTAGLRVLDIGDTPKLGAPMRIGYAGGLKGEVDTIQVTDPQSNVYGCGVGETLSQFSGFCDVKMPTFAMLGTWILVWQWDGVTDPRPNPCAPDLLYVPAEGSLPAWCERTFQVNG